MFALFLLCPNRLLWPLLYNNKCKPRFLTLNAWFIWAIISESVWVVLMSDLRSSAWVFRSCVPGKRSWHGPPFSRSLRRSCWSVESSSWPSGRSTCWRESSTSSYSSSTKTSPTWRRGKANSNDHALSWRMETASACHQASRRGHSLFICFTLNCTFLNVKENLSLKIQQILWLKRLSVHVTSCRLSTQDYRAGIAFHGQET